MSQPTQNMCEIAITPLPDGSPELLVSAASELYAENTDGLGIVAVHRIADDQFLYNRYKRADPDFDSGSDLWEFIDRNDEAWRFVIHARLATHGGTGWAETHPIPTRGCPECEIDMVVHNGVVYAEQTKRLKHERNGHEYTTDVDSEVIAHQYGELPTELDEDYEEPSLQGSLNYILFAEDRILVRHSYKYNVAEDFVMSTNKRGWLDESAERSGIHLFHADGEHESVAISRTYTSKYRGVKRTASRAAGWASQAVGYGQRTATTQSADSCETCQTSDEKTAEDALEAPTTVVESEDDVPPGLARMEDFEFATPGELTEREPIEREWVATVKDSGAVEPYHICMLHGTEFYTECKDCERIDWEVLSQSTKKPVTVKNSSDD